MWKKQKPTPVTIDDMIEPSAQFMALALVTGIQGSKILMKIPDCEYRGQRERSFL